MTNLDSILKSRDITLPTKVHLVKAMVFPVVMYGCESWTVKKAEHWKIDAFELWCWRRPLRVPWTGRRSNQSILKEISPGCSLGLMLKHKLQYFGHLMQRTDSLEKTLILGGIGAGGEGDDRAWDGWMASLTWWTWVWVNSRSLWWTGRPGVLWFMGLQRVRHNWETELNWTEWVVITYKVYTLFFARPLLFTGTWVVNEIRKLILWGRRRQKEANTLGKVRGLKKKNLTDEEVNKASWKERMRYMS